MKVTWDQLKVKVNWNQLKVNWNQFKVTSNQYESNLFEGTLLCPVASWGDFVF